MGFYIHVQETPNPNAVEFISFYTVKSHGKSNYRSAEEGEHVPVAREIFAVGGIEQIYLFDNYITVTKRSDLPWGELSKSILDLLQISLPVHDPDFTDPEPPASENQVEKTPEILAIEEILDRTVKPYLAADGGGIEVVERQGDKIFIKYQGACGTCPSSVGGTLIAIRDVLRDELGPDIEVIEVGGAMLGY
jgi:Fe-S cluster biogenesis protein NfuA